jgi:ubiquinone biosynthesis monooxygenase Coq7
LIAGFDQVLRTLAGNSAANSGAAGPAAAAPDTPMQAPQRIKSGRLMRINHTGEVCAQALYLGQATAPLGDAARAALQQTAAEETAHLAWCAQRLRELGTRPSLLNPAWFAGAFLIGAIAGRCGERASMGFLAETERQVVAHLDSHLKKLPREDQRSRCIVAQMRRDEAAHAATAVAHGAQPLPSGVRWLMHLQATVMTTVAARL